MQSSPGHAPDAPPPDASPAVTPFGSLRGTSTSSRDPPKLQSRATTALSLADIHRDPHDDNSSTSTETPLRPARLAVFASKRSNESDADASSIRSIRSFQPQGGGDVESLLEDMLGTGTATAMGGQDDQGPPPLQSGLDSEDLADAFATEFEPLPLSDEQAGMTEERVVEAWKAKLKHYLIFSSAGKPIYSRHGNDQLVSGTIGVIQTIISFYQGNNDALKSFTSGGCRFVIVSKGHMHLVAISRLGETDAQIRVQLESLYMQILSTLTLPTMERMFILRPSTDLRRPLSGTEGLISSLADGFTRGSPSTLLSALECLRISKTHRQTINTTFLKTKSPQLLYGLIVAGGRLASVLRPKKHSLHPGDLQLIFNMLFEADSIRANSEESWIPVCLPGFNNTGFLHMYVSFLDLDVTSAATAQEPAHIDKENEVAIVLISPKSDAFEELRNMRDTLVDQLKANGSFGHIQRAITSGRSSCETILATSGIASSPVRHFIYKSRANVQFVAPSAAPLFASEVSWRRLMSVYARLQGDLHGKTGNSKVVHMVTAEASALAWTSPTFEVYVVAGPCATKAALAKGAMGIVQWARREEERIFVLGGAVCVVAAPGL